MRKELTAERLRELLDYDPETGVFRWRVAKSRSVKAGSVAGTVNCQGYVQILIDGTKHQAHRLAWLWMTGEWPSVEIDHKDARPANNSWLNLRLAVADGNRYNTRRPRNNTTGFKGVVRVKATGHFEAKIGLGGKRIHLGTFPTAQEAHAAYCVASARYHGEFGRAE